MKLAVLGTGGMGRGLARFARSIEGVDRVVAMDVDPAALKPLEGQDRIETTTDLRAALDDPEVRLACVTSSNASHKPLVLAAIEAGKAVFCEKPIATTYADAREMVEAAEARGAFFQVGFECRYSRFYEIVKEWIDAGPRRKGMTCSGTT